MRSCIGEKEYNRFVEGTLSEEELERIHAHVKTCRDCSAEFESWKILKEMLASTSSLKVPQTLETGVMERIRQETIRPARSSAGFDRILAASLLLVTFAAWLFQPGFSPLIPAHLIDAAGYLSEMTYNFISFLGIDMGAAASFIRALIPVLRQLFWAFALGTFMLITGFGLCIRKGRRAHAE